MPLSREVKTKLAEQVKANGGTYSDFLKLIGEKEVQVSKLRSEASQMAQNRPQLIAEAQGQAMAEEYPLMSAMAPRQMQRVASGQESGSLGASVGDMLSLPGRMASSLMDFQGNTLEEKYQNYLQSVQQTEGQNLLGDIGRSPATGAALALTPFLPAISGGSALMAGLAEGGAIAGTQQLTNLGEGKELSLGQVLTDVGASIALPGFAPFFKKASDPIKETILKASEKYVNPALKSVASQLTGISGEALSVLSEKGGRKKLIDFSAKTKEIGDNLIGMLDNIDKNYKYEDQLKLALGNMPDINTQKIKDVLKSEIEKIEGKVFINKEQRAALPQLKEEYAQLSKLPKTMTAKDFRDFRKELDIDINFDNDGAKFFDNVMQTVRKEAKNNLIDASAGTPYKETMQNYSKALDARDKLYDAYLGKKGLVRNKRIQGFVDNLYGKNKDDAQEMIKNIDDVFGSGFSDQIKLSSLAKEAVKEGKIPFFNTMPTGRSVLGGLGGFTVGGPVGAALGWGASSPMVSAMALRGERGLSEMIGKSAGTGLGLAGDIMSNPILQRTVPGLARIPLQQSFTQGDQ